MPPATAYPKLERDKLVYRWDLDKTYLRTDFDSFRDIVRTAFESAANKRTVPGASSLLRELRATEPAGVYILSGSPEQMRRVLENKLRLDGVRWDLFTLKPSLNNLLRGRFTFLRDQVGYKLGSLLASREALPLDTDEILFGDDAEADAFVYSLYADLVAGRVTQDVLFEVLRQARVHPEEIGRLLRLAGSIPRRDICRQIFIHLDRVSSPKAFADYGRRVCTFYNYLQPALVLFEREALDVDALLRVAADLVIKHDFTPEALTASYLDIARRGYVGPQPAVEIRKYLSAMLGSPFASATDVLRRFGEELASVEHECKVLTDVRAPHIGFVELYERDRARAAAAKLRVLRR